MTFTVSIDVAAPAEPYDALHAALLKHAGAVSTALGACRLAHRDQLPDHRSLGIVLASTGSWRSRPDGRAASR